MTPTPPPPPLLSLYLYPFFVILVSAIIFTPLLIYSSSPLYAQSPNRSWEEQYDSHNIRRSSGMVTDTPAQVLQLPSTYSYGSNPDFSIASTPPQIDFGIPQLNPEYLSGGGPYGGWGRSSVGPNGNFYFNLGNHLGGGSADAFLFSYNPSTKTHQIEYSTKQVCNWSSSGDGKIHGDPDVAPNGDIWQLTMWGPTPSLSDFGSSYPGGRLIKYNINTKVAECLGSPDSTDAWPVHTWDWQRQRLYAVGEYGRYVGNTGYGKVLVYDTQNRQVIFSGIPTNNNNPQDQIYWYHRSLMLDPKTGILYGTDFNSQNHLVKYDPATNTFSRLNSSLNSPLRAWTKLKLADDHFWIFDYDGNVYKFYPQNDHVEYITKNWVSGAYVADVQSSPDHNYLYYIVASSSSSYGTPIVQLNVETNQKKVIAFLSDFYHQKYGYAIQGSYNLTVSADGSSLFTQVNGIFAPSISNNTYGRPAIFHIRIPASERNGDAPPTTPPTTQPTSPPTSEPTAPPTTDPQYRPGDINRDGIVDLTDYSILVTNFMKMESGNIADINQDNIVDLTDYSILVANFLQTSP